jgi:hypothetical protein
MFSAADQTDLIAAMPGAVSASVGGDTITVDFRTESEPALFTDGSIEQGKPYCIATAADVAANAIDHGSDITIASDIWYVIGKKQRQDGMFRLTLSVEP